MSNKIIEKYKNLYEACKKYPKIILSSRVGESPKVYRKPNRYAKDGFIEVFCKGIIMSKGKARWYPDKPQNNRQIPCPRYEKYSNGGCYCEQGDSSDAKICKGNPHNCVNTKYHRAASRSDEQINDGVFRKR